MTFESPWNFRTPNRMATTKDLEKAVGGAGIAAVDADPTSLFRLQQDTRLAATYVAYDNRPDSPLRHITTDAASVTDWAPAIRAAIGSGGRTVELPELEMTLGSRWGEPSTAHVIDIKDGTTLIGNPSKTLLRRSAALPPGSPLIFARDKTGFSIGGFRIDGNQDAITGTDGTNEDEGINIKTSTNFRLHDLEIFETFQEAVDIDTGTNVVLTNIYAHDCGGNGFHLTGSGGVDYLTATGLVAEACSFRRAATGLVQVGGLHHTGSHAVIEAKIINCYRGLYLGVGTDRNLTLDIVQSGDFEAMYGDSGDTSRTFITALVTRTGATDANKACVRFQSTVALRGGSIVDTSPAAAYSVSAAAGAAVTCDVVGTSIRQLGTGYGVNLAGGSAHTFENARVYAAALEAFRTTLPNTVIKGGKYERGNAGTVITGTAAATGMDVANADVRGTGGLPAQVNLTGTGSRKRFLSGYLTETRGAATIPDGSASVTFTHGLGPINAGTDVAYRRLSARSTSGAAPDVWFSGMTSTQATITRSGTTGALVVDYELAL
jgi:hypothetical protein